MKTHLEVDERSLAMHRLVAARVEEDPALFVKAKGTLSRWRNTVSASSQPWLDEWERLMERGIEACLAVVVEDSPRAAALRQSSPFSGVLSNQERFAFLREWRRGHETKGT